MPKVRRSSSPGFPGFTARQIGVDWTRRRDMINSQRLSLTKPNWDDFGGICATLPRLPIHSPRNDSTIAELSVRPEVESIMMNDVLRGQQYFNPVFQGEFDPGRLFTV